MLKSKDLKFHVHASDGPTVPTSIVCGIGVRRETRLRFTVIHFHEIVWHYTVCLHFFMIMIRMVTVICGTTLVLCSWLTHSEGHLTFSKVNCPLKSKILTIRGDLSSIIGDFQLRRCLSGPLGYTRRQMT